MENPAQHSSLLAKPGSEVTLSQNNFLAEGTNSKATTATQSYASSVVNAAMEKDVEKDAAGAGPGRVEVDPPSPATPTSEKAAGTGDGSPALTLSNPMDPAAYPEGGLKAWTVVFGANLALIVSFGWINCQYPPPCPRPIPSRDDFPLMLWTGIGVFQEYYETHQLRDYTSQEVAWIPSLEAFMMFAGGLWVGRAYGKAL